jgi:hypothetical protein
MVNREKIKKHLPNLLVDGIVNGSDPEYQRIRYDLMKHPNKQKKLIDGIEQVLVDFDFQYDSKTDQFYSKPIYRKKKT